jgi:hypothetical protein
MKAVVMKALPAPILAAAACLLPMAARPASPPASPETAAVELFSPEGYVKQVRQVTARFSAPMVALGDPRLDDPFTVNCPATGKGRWADTRNWVYDFDADLQAGVSCRFSLKPGLKSLAGAPVTGRSTFSFDSGGPAILASLPRQGWAALDEDQVFLLLLDAPATQASIEAHAYCAIDGITERVALQVLSGQERQQILEQRRALGYDYLELLWKSGARSDVRVRDRAMQQRDELITVLRCQRRLRRFSAAASPGSQSCCSGTIGEAAGHGWLSRSGASRATGPIIDSFQKAIGLSSIRSA